VKRFSADDTEGGIPWENMPLPGTFFIAFFFKRNIHFSLSSEAVIL
jgi:hypothetical protein